MFIFEMLFVCLFVCIIDEFFVGEMFASCPVDGTAVESVLDSSRYFVLRIQDGSGKWCFI
jgi:adaptin ear-binding coat-associated protein 1/2